MALFQWFADLRGATRELKRIADALDRACPPSPTTFPAEPEDISYSDDDALALEEIKEQARKLGILDEEEDVQPEGH